MITHGDCLDVMRAMPSSRIDAIATDPPYGLQFMGKDWDKALPDPEVWAECLRVAKPGAHLVAFGAPRLYHRLAVAIEDAGWELRDCLMWLYGTGFPKSLDVSKAIDKAAGAEREVVGPGKYAGRGRVNGPGIYGDAPSSANEVETSPATDAARQWDGWGTALKPAWEPILLARKPLAGTVAANVEAHGTGAMNIDGCRVGTSTADDYGRSAANARGTINAHAVFGGKELVMGERDGAYASAAGRWPANLVLDEEAGEMLGESARYFYCPKASRKERWVYLTCDCETAKPDEWVNVDRSAPEQTAVTSQQRGTSERVSMDACASSTPSCGSESADPSRRASKSTTGTGTSSTTGSGISSVSPRPSTSGSTAGARSGAACGGSLARSAESGSRSMSDTGTSRPKAGRCMGVAVPATSAKSLKQNVCVRCGSQVRDQGHPTLKPLALMRWLVRLITPPGGLVLDPFMGSGSTGVACAAEGLRFEGIEMVQEYVEIARARIPSSEISLVEQILRGALG